MRREREMPRSFLSSLAALVAGAGATALLEEGEGGVVVSSGMVVHYTPGQRRASDGGSYEHLVILPIKIAWETTVDTYVGIWGDLVKRTRPAPESKAEETPRPALARLPLLEEAPAEEAIDPRQATVVLTSALSRPLVLTPLPEDPPPVAPPQKLPTPEVRGASVSEAESLVALLERFRVPPPLSSLSYTPEQAIAFLSALPAHLTPEARYAQMEQELSRAASDDQALAAELVGEAAARLVELRRELTTGQTAHSNRQTLEQGRIEALAAELARLQAEYEAQEASYQQERQAQLTRLDEMTGVIVFFDAYQAYRLQRGGRETPSPEVPAFLQEETAAKLLGLTSSGSELSRPKGP